MKKFGMLIDVQYCTGCHTCEVACQQENRFDAEQFGIKVTEHILNQKNRLMIDYVPYITDLCNFCMARVAEGRKPSCVKHCLAQCMTFGPVDEVVEAAKNGKKPMLYLK
jgi:Fe-S-cluster-containing dehydrogenase component